MIRALRLPLWTAVVLAAGPLRAANTELPPLMEPQVQEHPGKFIWAELLTPDLSAAERFYGGLFGWTFHDVRLGDITYATARIDGAPVAGLVQRPVRPDRPAQPAWLTFLSVPNVQQVGQAIVTNGGKQLAPPRAYRQRGRQAVYADPQGAVFAILNSHSGDPPDVMAAPGEWIWTALVTRDPDADAGFYQQVFGFEVYPLPRGARGDHLVLATEQFARASVNPLPRDGMAPHWVDFVRVEDVGRAVDKARSLGGKVLVEAHADRHGGTVALLADPAGAAIGVMDWTQTSPPAGSQ